MTVAVLAALLFGSRVWRRADPAPARAALIAVLPFTVTAESDSDLVRLGRDLVITLSANLDEVGELRARRRTGQAGCDHAGRDHWRHAGACCHARLAGEGRRVGAAPEPTPDATGTSGSAELAWWRGIRAAHRGDAAGLESARAVLATSSAGATATLLDRSLAAFGRALAADTAGAAAVLVGLERERSQRRLFGNGHPYLTPVDRLAASRWLRVLGDTAQASELLTWTDAVAFYAPHVNEVNAMVAGVVYRERAALEEAAGRGQRAAGLYRQFIDRVDLPSARQRDRIAHARQFVAAWPPDLPRVRR